MVTRIITTPYTAEGPEHSLVIVPRRTPKVDMVIDHYPRWHMVVFEKPEDVEAWYVCESGCGHAAPGEDWDFRNSDRRCPNCGSEEYAYLAETNFAILHSNGLDALSDCVDSDCVDSDCVEEWIHGYKELHCDCEWELEQHRIVEIVGESATGPAQELIPNDD